MLKLFLHFSYSLRTGLSSAAHLCSFLPFPFVNNFRTSTISQECGSKNALSCLYALLQVLENWQRYSAKHFRFSCLTQLHVILFLTEIKSARFESHTPSCIFHAIKSFYLFLLVWRILGSLSVSENFAIHYSGDEIKKSGMGGSCSTCGEKCAQSFCGKIWGKETTWKNKAVNLRIILKWIFRKWVVIAWTGFIWLRVKWPAHVNAVMKSRKCVIPVVCVKLGKGMHIASP